MCKFFIGYINKIIIKGEKIMLKIDNARISKAVDLLLEGDVDLSNVLG